MQERLQYLPRRHDDASLSKSFEKLISVGNVHAAIIITDQKNNGPIPLNQLMPDGLTAKEHLLDKHPPGVQPSPEAIWKHHRPKSPVHLVVYEEIDGALIRSTMHYMSGSAGPSGLDARACRRLCCSFHVASDELANSIAKVTKKLCSTYVNTEGISALVACGLVTLDKSPGLQPIGVGEVLRCLISNLHNLKK